MEKQIFQSKNKKRWSIFIYTALFLSVSLILFIVVISYYVGRQEFPALPLLQSRETFFKKIDHPGDPLKLPVVNHSHIVKHSPNEFLPSASLKRKLAHKIRAGFYVNWDLQSFRSMQENIGKMNMVLPEWIFVQDSSNHVSTNIDRVALNVMRKHNIPIVPMLTNFFNGKWNGENVHRIIKSKNTRKDFIENLLSILQREKFQGINIDFEELNEEGDENLIAFQKELYAAFHTKGFLVTQDISPGNEDYNVDSLQKYNDYIFLMAYDQHYPTSVAGPISDQKWVEKVLDQLLEKVKSEKVVLCMAAYGYDWPTGGEAYEVSYQQAISLSKEKNAKIDFNNHTYNLDFSYKDDNGVQRSVFFTDAATNFNTIRTSEDFELAGVALWRLGSEDKRLWSFFNKELSYDGFSPFSGFLDSLKIVFPSNQIDYLGEGEILNIISTPQAGKIQVHIDAEDKLISEEKYLQLPTCYVVKKFGRGQKEVILTFDDGPDERYTPMILDTLKKYNVPATFFVIGVNVEQNIPLLKRIYDDGFEIGNHTFTHPNLALISKERAEIEINATRKLIESITGHSTVLFRPPFNADAEPSNYQEIMPVALSKQENYYTVGETIDPLDWEAGVTADSIVARVIAEEGNGSILLLHDAGGDRSETVKALPRIIAYYKSQGYKFITVADLIGKNRSELMPPIKSITEKYLSKMAFAGAHIFYFIEQVMYKILLLGIFLAIARLLFVATMASIQKRKTKNEIIDKSFLPLVSVIVPAYNEEVNAVKTLDNLLKSDYPNLEIIFVNDGSKDTTLELVKEKFFNHSKIKILDKSNGGKASALNLGMAAAQGEYLVCVDSDTQLNHDAISFLIPYLKDENVAGVAGNVKVGNDKNILTKWQSIEYITSQNFDRRAFDELNAITVIPGAIGAFKKEIVKKLGGFTTDTLAEDADLTMRILEAGFQVRYCDQAIAITEAPETLAMFTKQRLRWTYGTMQCYWKQKKNLFSLSTPALGWFALPNILLFQMILPLLGPFADVIILFALIGGFASHIINYYLLFLVIELLTAAIAFRFEKTSMLPLVWLIPQRIIYKQILWYILIKSYLKALKGEVATWGFLSRTGKVKTV
jgi:cellulose synthase/poly-beta-1,6-N-acetylglucosamine synthase-like glycosyltransferase/peptidoglycan/xylan/chitin deacetylase (PgdA/CDA1 family)/spore germination protein YaaH